MPDPPEDEGKPSQASLSALRTVDKGTVEQNLSEDSGKVRKFRWRALSASRAPIGVGTPLASLLSGRKKKNKQSKKHTKTTATSSRGFIKFESAAQGSTLDIY